MKSGKSRTETAGDLLFPVPHGGAKRAFHRKTFRTKNRGEAISASPRKQMVL
jgi:hypothetical protein